MVADPRDSAAPSQDSLLAELRPYLRTARAETELYGAKLAGLDDSSLASLADFRNAVDVTRKEELLRDQEEDPPYGTRLAVPEREVGKVHLTSGTSGRGREVWAASVEDEETLVEQLSLGFPRIGLTKADTIFNTLPIGTTAAGDWLSKAFEDLGANVFNVGPYSTERKVRMMDRFDATAVFATPSYLDQLQHMAAKLEIDLQADTVMTATDSLPESLVARIENQWNAKLYEEYGVTEGASLWTCEQGVLGENGRGTVHFAQEYCYYEVVDPEDPTEHVSDGEFGELVITPFACRRAMPLVRFATGDRVRYVAPGSCPCDVNTGGIESGTIERFDDMLKIKGVNVWPQAVNDVVFSYDDVLEYSGEVFRDDDGRERAKIYLEWNESEQSRGETAAKMGDIESDIERKIGIHVDVEEAHEPLPDYSSAENKADRWDDFRGA